MIKAIGSREIYAKAIFSRKLYKGTNARLCYPEWWQNHRESLNTDYTQMAHHGQNGVKRDFYEHIIPKRCIWPSPDWLWDNDNGDGFDTGPWQTVRTREWIGALGVTEHFIEKNGTQIIEI